MALGQTRRELSSFDDAVLVAQYRMLAKHLPVIYVATLGGGILVAELFAHHAPAIVIYPILTLLTLISVVRLSYWLNARLQHGELDHMRKTIRQAPYFGIFYFGVTNYWVYSLTAYGSEAQQITALAFIVLAVTAGVAFNTHIPQNICATLIAGAVPVAIQLILIDTHSSLVLAGMFALSVLGQIVYAKHQHRSFLAAIRDRVSAEHARLEAENARRDITRIAETDVLTGIANRRAFIAAIGRHATQSQPFALAIMDINGFKPINDLYGHGAGDNVLFSVANRLKAAVSGRGFVARLAGDEFGLLITDHSDQQSVLALAQSIVRSIDRPIVIDEAVIQVTASFGIAAYPLNSTNPARILEQADQALTFAKRAGRGVVTMYDDEIENREARRNLIESRLRTAIVNQSFDLAYQPILNLETGATTAYEALARWTDSHLGPVSPGEFIPIAEQSGLIGELADILFERAIIEASHWPKDVALSFNLSPVQFLSTSISFKILSTLSTHGFSPARLLLEVTETALLKNLDHAELVISQLRSAGIRLALDDFGVGYAGFGYLDRLTFDKVKIDRSFVNGMKDNSRKRQIVTAIVDMCHRLNMKCVAEGIEEQGELDFLKSIGCEGGQGYLLGRPGPPPSLSAPEQTKAAVA